MFGFPLLGLLKLRVVIGVRFVWYFRDHLRSFGATQVEYEHQILDRANHLHAGVVGDCTAQVHSNVDTTGWLPEHWCKFAVHW